MKKFFLYTSGCALVFIIVFFALQYSILFWSLRGSWQEITATPQRMTLETNLEVLPKSFTTSAYMFSVPVSWGDPMSVQQTSSTLRIAFQNASITALHTDGISFDQKRRILETAPQHLFPPYPFNNIIPFLTLKSLSVPSLPIYYFESELLHGYQFGDPVRTGSVYIEIFFDNTSTESLSIKTNHQNDVNAIIASISRQ